jgi:hypothetical protein
MARSGTAPWRRYRSDPGPTATTVAWPRRAGLWAEGRLYPAPLSRAKVKALAVSRRRLTFSQ